MSLRGIDKRVPCYKCEDRKVGCHAECEKYKTYKENRKNLKIKETDYRIRRSGHV